MASTRSSALENATDREILVTRVFTAPRAKVWAAWVDPWQITQWWGPKGFTITMSEMDPRPGGRWCLVMHGPDGTRYPNDCVYTEVIPQQRLAYRLSGGKEGAPLAHFETIATFEDEADGTRVTIRTVFDSPETRDRNVREYNSIEGAQQMFQRLQTHLVLSQSPIRTPSDKAGHGLCITRTFNAPRELVWRAWTDPEMAKNWSGPKQFPARHVELGKKPGDRWRICLRGCPPGTLTPVDLWQGGVLREIVPPERLVYTYAWDRRSDVGLPEDGDPHETLITVLFQEQDGKTTMHFHQTPFATAAERDGHNGGWSSSFERLADLVHSLSTHEHP
jgi:uncharacterized protein YndB with AHSA1/START domain